MAAEYEVNIKLNTDQITKDLNTVGGKIKDLGKTQNTKAKKALSNSDAVLKKEIAILATENRALRTKGQLLKLEKDGFGIKGQLRKLDEAIAIANKGEVDFAKTLIQKQEKGIILRKNQLATETKITEQRVKQAALSTGITSPVFGKPGQIGSPSNISAVLNDPLSSVSPVQQALKKMDDETKLNQKQAILNRKKSLSLGKANLKIVQDEVKGEQQKVRLLAEQNKLDNKIAMSGISPQGAFSRLSDRQSRNAQGGRTFMNNPFFAGMSRLGATRGFDTQSALISGAFPLLFGQGPVGAVAGGLGGGLGGMFGTMGGFAGGIAATAIVQQIQNAINGISELGKALGPFAKNTDAVTTALGLQGSAEEARIQMLEKTQGKTAAFNAAMQVMNVQIGERGVDALSEFGETTRLMNNQFAIAITRIGAFTAGLLNFVNKTLGIQQGLNKGAANRALELGVARGDKRALALEARQAEIDKMDKVEQLQLIPSGTLLPSAIITEVKSKEAQALQDLLDLDIQRFKVITDTEAEAAQLTEKFDSLISANQKEEELTARVLELRRKGLNPEVAKTVAEIEKQANLSKEALDNEINQLQKKKELSVDEQTRLDTLIKQKKAITDGVKGLDQKLQKTHDLTEAATQTLDAFEKLRDTITIDIGNGIKGLIKGTESLNDVLRNVVDKLADAALNMAIFGNAGGGSVTGGLLGAIGFANGGRPPVGRASIVGERGPELFVPDRAGTIIPNNQLDGGTNIVVNVDASGSSVEGDEQGGRELGLVLSAAIESELIKQKRPGGLLA